MNTHIPTSHDQLVVLRSIAHDDVTTTGTKLLQGNLSRQPTTAIIIIIIIVTITTVDTAIAHYLQPKLPHNVLTKRRNTTDKIRAL